MGKTFTAIDSSTSDDELTPLEFTIDGRLLKPIERAGEEPVKTWAEDFAALRVAPSGALDDLMRAIGKDDRGRTVFNSVSLQSFMRSVLVDEDQEQRFDALMRDKNRLVPIQTLGDIVLWLAEEQSSGRPTPRS